jgi:hypothetical protein
MVDTLSSSLRRYANSFQVELRGRSMEVLSKNWCPRLSFNHIDILTTITAHALPIGLASLVLWTIYGVIYRLYLSPISTFPGPKLAALSFWHSLFSDLSYSLV